MTARGFVAALVALAVLGSAYLGLKVGRQYERNQWCCQMTRGRNLSVSLRETLGLVRFASQIGQDRWVIETVFPGVTDGYFLDVGSGHGREGSNSWALEQRGWRGICVDPFPSHMDGRTCQMLREVVDAVSGRRVTFSQAQDVGGITDLLGRWKAAAASAPTVTLTTVTLADILRRAQAPRTIHFLSLDIEGAELRALQGFPFETYTVGALAVEHNYEEPKRTAIFQLLTAHGYRRSHSWLQDDFYVR